MKKAVLIIVSILLLSCLFATVAFAVPADAMPLRAGGSVGGGGGIGGGFGHFRGSEGLFDNIDETGGKGLMLRTVEIVLYIVIIAMHVITGILVPVIVLKRKRKARKETRRLMAEYDDFDGFWSYDYIQNRINEVYFAVQKAWADGDMRAVEGMITESLLKKYQKHLDAQRRDGEKNVMENVKLKSAVPVYAKDFTNNEHDYFWAKIEGSMIDYVILEETGSVLQGTKADESFCEYWKFNRDRNGMWVLAEIMQQAEFENTHFYKNLSKF